MNHKTSQAGDAEFACATHSELKGKERDKCPKYEMNLEKVVAQGKVTMTLTTNREQVEAGKPVRLSFRPLDESDSSVLAELEETHEKKIHVINMGEDLSWFSHIHAELDYSSTYTVDETFPNGGIYLVYADYKPLGRPNRTDKFTVNVRGAKKEAAHYHEPKIVSTTDGYTLTIDDVDKLCAGSVAIPFAVEKDGKTIERSHIQNYLGAVAHIILVSQEDKNFIHIHPESTDKYPILAHADIPKAGIYRMWVQFQTEGTVHTADFTLDIKGRSGGVAVSARKHSHAVHEH